jgi:hypothetical protein
MMHPYPPGARMAAGAIVLMVAGALAALVVGYGSNGLAEAVRALSARFGVLTAVLVAAVMSRVAAGLRVAATTVAALTLWSVAGGLFHFLGVAAEPGRGPAGQAGAFGLAALTPALLAGFWLVFTPKGQLGWADPVVWLVWPVAFGIYALVRGAAAGSPAYALLDVQARGLPPVLGTLGAAGLLLLVLGYLIVAADMLMDRHRNPG